MSEEILSIIDEWLVDRRRLFFALESSIARVQNYDDVRRIVDNSSRLVESVRRMETSYAGKIVETTRMYLRHCVLHRGISGFDIVGGSRLWSAILLEALLSVSFHEYVVKNFLMARSLISIRDEGSGFSFCMDWLSLLRNVENLPCL